MTKLRTKITGILLILFSYENAYPQLTLEDIFLTNKFTAKQAEEVEFLHTKPGFAKLTDSPKGKSITFFNNKNEKTGEWKIPDDAGNSGTKNIDWDDLLLSNTDQYFLISSGCEQIYRRSFECTYFIGDPKGTLQPLSSGKQLYPAFSPDDKKVAFIKDNNLFYKDVAGGNEVQVTGDGKWNHMINGKSDWVYEEELELTRAFEWNAKSDKIAYIKFDESDVREYSIPMYYDMQYPNLFTYKYPKVGEVNSKVSVWIYDVKSGKNKQIPIPFSYEYIPRIYWNAAEDEVIAMLLNRHQDSLQLASYNIKTKQTKQLYLDAGNTYVDVPKMVRFLSDNSFIINSERDGYDHLYHYDKEGKLLRQLTRGDYEVNEIYGVDEINKLLYYQSNEGNALETVIYSLNYETLEKKKLSPENGSNDAVFSNDFSFFVHSFSSATTPPRISLQQTDLSPSVVMEDNKNIRDSLSNIPKKEFIKIPIGNYFLNAWMIKPKDFDSTKKYPVLMYVYGGPGNQEVLNEWQRTRDLFYNYLAEREYVIVCVDNRGTGGRGAAFKKCTFLNLGKLETLDQIESARYLGSLSYIDKNRIGILGWSYGGFMAANCLFAGNDVFKTAIAIGPVADWSLYDDIYTERYMRTPKENPLGYKSFNPDVLAGKLKGNLLLIHGMADDNVHFQNTVFLINALNAAGKNYRLYIYPDKEHSIAGKRNRFDIFSKMADFLMEKL